MNLGQMRALLRRFTQDTVAQEWTNDELNAIINEGYLWVQKELRKVDVEAHVITDRVNTVAGESWYPLPQTFSLLRVRLQDTAAETGRTILLPKRLSDIENLQGTTQYYALRGQFIAIYPAPTEAVVGGLEIEHDPILELAEDDDLPRLKLPLHLAIVYKAREVALGDTDESTGEFKDRLASIMSDLGQWYNQQGDENMKLIPDIGVPTRRGLPFEGNHSALND